MKQSTYLCVIWYVSRFFTWFLILGKIKNGSQDSEYVWWRHRPLAAPIPIEYKKTLDNNDLNQVGVQRF